MSAPHQVRFRKSTPTGPDGAVLVFFEDSLSPLEISKGLLEELCRQVNEGAMAKGGPTEIGGLLTAPKVAAGPVAVARLAPLRIEHRFGPTFHLSPADFEALEQAVGLAHRNPVEAVVGFYRSRTRGDEIPRETDQEILDRLERLYPDYETDFRYFLVLTPLSNTLMEVSVARRQDGAWHEWQNFKLRTQPMSLVPEAREAEKEQRGTPGKVGLPPGIDRMPVAPPKPPARAAAEGFPQSWAWTAGIALAVLAIATGVNLWISAKRAEPAAVSQPAPAAEPGGRTGFAANPEGGMWKLTWNRDQVAALHPSGAMLSIRDGDNEQQVPLTEADLATGTVFYTPKNGSLVFGLILVTPGGVPVEEHVRVLQAEAAAPRPPATAEPRVRIEHEVRILRPFVAPVKAAEAPGRSKSVPAELAPPPALRAAGTTPTWTLPVPMQSPSAPAPTPSAPAPTPSVAAPTPNAPAPAREATAAIPLARPPAPATPAPATPPQPLRNVYLPPKPIRQMPAVLPANISLPTAQKVQVRVEIDARGRVTRVNPVERNAAKFPLVDAAAQAARYWLFEPAQENGHPVASEMLLNFQFAAR